MALDDNIISAYPVVLSLPLIARSQAVFDATWAELVLPLNRHLCAWPLVVHATMGGGPGGTWTSQIDQQYRPIAPIYDHRKMTTGGPGGLQTVRPNIFGGLLWCGCERLGRCQLLVRECIFCATSRTRVSVEVARAMGSRAAMLSGDILAS